MKRLILFGLIGFAVGLGGGVGVSFARAGDATDPSAADAGTHAEAEPAAVEADSTAADSVAADSAAVAPDADVIGREIAASLIRSPDSAADAAGGQPADSTAADAAAADTAAAPDEPSGDSARVVPADSAGVPEAGTDPSDDAVSSEHESAGDPGVSGAGEARLAATLPELSEGSEEGYRKMSRILAAMDATEAARVLDSLQDAEVRRLIGFLPARTAAAILTELDPARVARLGRGFWNPSTP